MTQKKTLLWAAALGLAAFFISKQTQTTLEAGPVARVDLDNALMEADRIIQEAMATGQYLTAAQALTGMHLNIMQTAAYTEKLNFLASAAVNSVFDYAVIKAILTLYVTTTPFAKSGINALETKIEVLT